MGVLPSPGSGVLCEHARRMDERATSAAPTKRSASALKVAGALLVVYGLYYMNREVFTRAFASQTAAAPDPITTYEDRWAPVRAGTPPDGSYGFVSDAGLEGPEVVKRLFIAEYALAPRLLRVGTSEPLVLGVFEKPFAATLRQQHLQIVKDFGRGVLLLRAAP
jgi:hypothetical protein